MSATLYEAHNQWRNRPDDQRFQSLAELKKAVENRRNLSCVVDIDVHDLGVSVVDIESEVQTPHSKGLILDVGIAPTRPNHWSFGQLCRAINAPADFLRNGVPTEMAANIINYRLKAAEKSDHKLMTLRDPEGEAQILQAVTSQTYGRIWDAEVVGQVEKIVDASGGKFFNPKAYKRGSYGGETVPSGLYASDRDVFIFMIDGGSLIDGGGERDQLHRGFFVWNSETGSKTFGCKLFMFRSACGNHFVYGAEQIQSYVVRHSAGGPAKFMNDVAPTLLSYVNESAKPLELQIKKAKEYALPTVEEELIKFGRERGFSKGETTTAIATARREEGKCDTLWDFLNGMTASAREYAFIDARVELEERAGKLLNLVK